MIFNARDETENINLINIVESFQNIFWLRKYSCTVLILGIFLQEEWGGIIFIIFHGE